MLMIENERNPTLDNVISYQDYEMLALGQTGLWIADRGRCAKPWMMHQSVITEMSAHNLQQQYPS